MSVQELFAAAGIMGGVISTLFGGGYLLSRSRRERDWGDAIGSLRKQVADLAADLAGLRRDFDALQWAVTQEPHDTQVRIFSRAERWQRNRRDKDADRGD